MRLDLPEEVLEIVYPDHDLVSDPNNQNTWVCKKCGATVTSQNGFASGGATEYSCEDSDL